jgi:hypothetical protein
LVALLAFEKAVKLDVQLVEQLDCKLVLMLVVKKAVPWGEK